ncbi:MAG: Na(+)-translocating NADH-quinone reductase subunit A [Pseudomonadota bacterium]
MSYRQFRIKRGLDLPLQGAPEPVIEDGASVRSVAVLGPDYEGLKPSMSVAEGEEVALGQVLFSDRRNPRIQFVSPGAGTVREVVRGPRRRLFSVIIDLGGDAEVTFDAHAREDLAGLDRETVVEQFLASGLWTGLRSRPFIRTPDPDAPPPSAIFVTAMDSNPLAGSLAGVMAEHSEAFAAGVEVMLRLTDGPVYVCCSPGAPVPTFSDERVRVAEFSGPHPAGLPGTHIHMLHPVSAKRSVWHLAMQEVVSIGKLFTTGRLWTERVISLSGPMVERPRMLRTRLGASLNDLLTAELKTGSCRVVSGSVLDGHRATNWAAYLGRFSRQVTALAEGEPRRFFGWLMPGMDRYSSVPAFGGALRSSRFPLSTTMNGSARAMVPIGNLESVLPLDMLPAPLLKALIVGDTDMAQKLGCLELDQEDLALCSFVCPSKYDYGAYLRESLNKIEKEG